MPAWALEKGGAAADAAVPSFLIPLPEAHLRTLPILAALLFVATPVLADPILPAQDKTGSLMKYQALSTADRKATLEAFTGKPLQPGNVFDNLDACTLRQTTEPGGETMRLSKAVTACVKELNL